MNKIYFSSVWEDYQSLKEGLHPSENDVILSVSSSGDNIFNLITDKVKKVIAVDINPAQLYLAKLKLEIIRGYESQKVSEILTGTGNKNENKLLLDKILSSDEKFKKYFSGLNFNKGIDNIGEFETKVLPVITFFAKRFFKSSDFQHNKITRKKSKIWLNILSILISFKSTYKFILPDFPYQYINIKIGKNLRICLNNFLIFNDLSNNWYLQKIYFGQYHLLPPFLRPSNLDYIKKNLDKITFIENNILDSLRELEDNSIDKVNLSDIFDWCSQEEYFQILHECHRVLTQNGIIFYWELFVSREVPSNMIGKLEILREEADSIHRKDNLPFYHGIVMLRKR